MKRLYQIVAYGAEGQDLGSTRVIASNNDEAVKKGRKKMKEAVYGIKSMTARLVSNYKK